MGQRKSKIQGKTSERSVGKLGGDIPGWPTGMDVRTLGRMPHKEEKVQGDNGPLLCRSLGRRGDEKVNG